ncbi:hypothetical protein [Streptomyces naphthomycinicus]|uniref:hypothetical protein n=1 Tax=Streptomyces naphthomycinicus TaxID=2872625 RepID=UPI001CEC5D7C|nr:hypothetical protein [Streptomyces sp. TML10]
MAAQYAPAHRRDGFTIQQIADRFEVYHPSGEFFGEYLVRDAAEKQVTVLVQRAERSCRSGR